MNSSKLNKRMAAADERRKTKTFDRSRFMHLSMLSPRGGTLGICGAFDLYCLPHPWEFDLESGPQGGDVCFFCTEEWDQVTSSHVLVCHLGIEVARLKP